MASKPPPPILEIDGVPTAEGLVVKGRQYAYRVTGGIHITDAGYDLIREATLTNVNRNYARGDHIWTPPPSTLDLPVTEGKDDD